MHVPLADNRNYSDYTKVEQLQAAVEAFTLLPRLHQTIRATGRATLRATSKGHTKGYYQC